METVPNVAFAVAQAPSQLDPLNDSSELAACVLPHLGSGRLRSCRLVRWLKRRREKWVAEIEAASPNGNGSAALRYIVRMHRRDRTLGSYEALSRLWEAGFRPPSCYTVVRPVAYIADKGLLIQEKARGTLLLDVLLGGANHAIDALVHTAAWLAKLHGAGVEAKPRLGEVAAAVRRYGCELMKLLPRKALRVERLMDCAVQQLEPHQLSNLVPSHGDFHPENIFITPGGGVTVTDLDTFGLQERAADVAYFLAQVAIMSYFRRGSFAATTWARQCFLQAYTDLVPSLPRRRVAFYLGMAFLQSLHYELWVLRNGKAAIVEPWLDISERGLLDGEVALI